MSEQITPAKAPFSIEAHGPDGYVFYSGRINGMHGLNLFYIKEPDWNWKANFEFIVRACNAHDDLVETLEDARNSLLLVIVDKFGHDKANWPKYALDNMLLNEIDEVLNKAKGDK